MRGLRRLAAALLTGALLWMPCVQTIPAAAEDETDELWSYMDYGDGTVSVTCQDNTIEEAVIPEKIDGLTVTMIEVDCFIQNENLRRVTIPSTVTVVDDYAFYGCSSLESVTLPQGLGSIGFQAFCGCASLTQVRIPASVTEIEDFAFYGCNSLEGVYVSDGNKNYTDDDGVLYDIDRTKLILYPSQRQDTSFTVPESCTTLADYAFIGNSYLQEIDMHGITALGEDCFYYCTALQHAEIPEGITELQGAVFGNCRSLASVTLPDGLTRIGSGCFYNCFALPEITLPESLTSIGDNAFFNCPLLKTIAVSEHVTDIGSKAMGYYYSDHDEEVLLPNFTIDAKNGTAAFAYAAQNEIRCTGGVTQGIVFIYIIVGVVVLVIAATIVLIVVQRKIQKRYEIR